MNDNKGRPFAAEQFAAVRDNLTERFGGLTAFTRSPAQGTIKDGAKTVRSEIVVFEVMTETLDESWCASYGRHLEHVIQQDEIIVRALAINLL
ncbi:hypothetical protein ACVWXO_004796 [Bradyrhizobium sp. LM2.7]